MEKVNLLLMKVVVTKENLLQAWQENRMER